MHSIINHLENSSSNTPTSQAKVKRTDNTRGLVESTSNSYPLLVGGCISFLLLCKKTFPQIYQLKTPHIYCLPASAGQESRHDLLGPWCQKSAIKDQPAFIFILKLDWGRIHFQTHSGCCRIHFLTAVASRTSISCWLLDKSHSQLLGRSPVSCDMALSIGSSYYSHLMLPGQQERESLRCGFIRTEYVGLLFSLIKTISIF